MKDGGQMQNAKFKLYHDAALRSSRVKWLLHEIVGDDFIVEYVDTCAARQYEPDYLAKNPSHGVPVLEITLENGQSMTMIESAAMITLLADAFPEKDLAPAPGQLSFERADYLQVVHFGASIDMMLWQIRIHAHVLAPAERDARTVLRYKKKFVTEVEPQLRKRLEKTPFICGDRFSAADCIIAHCIMWAQIYQLCIQDVFKHYMSRVSQRPAFGSAFSDVDRFVLDVPAESPVVRLFAG
jgi:glutathione S-transferase